jgi:hypothetical protein
MFLNIIKKTSCLIDKLPAKIIMWLYILTIILLSAFVLLSREGMDLWFDAMLICGFLSALTIIMTAICKLANLPGRIR